MTPGECCACKHAPVERYRFNLIVEDCASRKPHTQLLCLECLGALIRTLIGQSVERTPQNELDNLKGIAPKGGW